MNLLSSLRKKMGRILFVSLMIPIMTTTIGGSEFLLAKEPAIEKLKTDLRSPKANTRRKAAKALGQTFSRDATPPLLMAADDKDVGVRREVVKALGLLRDENATTILLTSLNDEASSVRKESIVALVNLYIEQDVGFSLSRQAQRLYKKLNPFTDQVSRDSTVIEPDVVVGLAVMDAIAERLSDSNKSICIYAANALGVLRAQSAIPQMVTSMKKGSADLRVACLRSFYKIKDRSVDEHILIYLNDTNQGVRDEAILTLGLFKSLKALPQLQVLYDQNPDTKLRVRALEAISLVGDPGSLDLFRRNLRDPDHLYRQFAAEGIARVGDKSMVEEVSRIFLAENKLSTQLALSFALFRLGRPEYLDKLVSSLKDRFHHDQSEAYLLELGLATASELVKYLDDNNPRIRQRLCRVLGLIGDSASVESLKPLMQDTDADVVLEAALAVRRIGARQS